MPDRSQRTRRARRIIDLATEKLATTVLGLVEWTKINSMESGAGEAPFAETDEGEEVQVLEPYGYASSPPGAATAIVVAPGGELQGRVAIGVSSVEGRPETAAGDATVYTASGHQMVLDDDESAWTTRRVTSP
jgi:hypothetical protein